MKTLIVIILCSLSSTLLVHAQNYVPFPEQNAVWLEHETWLDSHPKDNSTCTDNIYETDGDTTINNIKYIKLNRTTSKYVYGRATNIGCTNQVTNPNYPYKSLFCLFRNDTSQKKVYIWDFYSQNERLLYDFNLNVNDTINQNLINGTSKVWVDSVTVKMFNSYNRKVYYLSNQAVLIEGIGYTSGLIKKGFASDSLNHLACMQVNDTSIFSKYNGCLNTTSIKDLRKETDLINIYPNPVKDQFKIETSQEQELKEIELFDLTGKSVHIYNSNQLEFSVKGVSPGVYILRIEETDNKLYTKKLIVR